MATFTELRKLKNRVAARKSHYDSNVQPHDRKLSDNIMPERGRFDDIKPDENPDRFTNLLDHTSSVASKRYAASLYAGLTPPTREWKQLTTKNRDIRELGAVKADLEARNKIINTVLSESNFYNVIADFFKEAVCFGRAPIFIERNFDRIVSFHTFTAGTYYIAEDSEGIVDTFYRRYSDTIDNIIDKFGIDNVSDKIKVLAASPLNGKDNGHVYRDLVHCVEPNRGRDRTKQDNLNMKFRSVYYEEGCEENNKVLRVSGYDEFPLVVGRLEKIGSDVYGWSPCAQVLGLTKAVNRMVEDALVASQDMADPLKLIPTALQGQNLKAGGAIYYDGTLGDNPVINASQVRYDISANMAMSDQFRTIIGSILHQDLFTSILGLDQAGMTATEINQRVAQAANLQIEVVSRMISEVLQPLLELVYERIDEAGAFPEPPPEMVNQDLEVMFVSSLALAQQAVGIVGIEQIVDFVTRLAQIDPTVIDKFNADQALDEYIERNGAPVKIVNTDEEAAATRQQREVVEEQNRTAELLSMTADGAEKLGNTPMNTGSALDTVVEGMQNAQ